MGNPSTVMGLPANQAYLIRKKASPPVAEQQDNKLAQPEPWGRLVDSWKRRRWRRGGANPNQLYDHRGNPLPPGSANAFNAQGMPVGPTGQPRQLTLQERQMGITGGVPQSSAQAGRGGLSGKLGGLFGGAAGGGALGALTGKGGQLPHPATFRIQLQDKLCNVIPKRVSLCPHLVSLKIQQQGSS